MTAGTDHLRVVVRQLPASYRPAQVRRHEGVTLVAVDPRSTRLDVTAWAVDALTRDELDAFRVAYGQPPVGAPLDDAWMTDEPFPRTVPSSLRLETAACGEVHR